MKNALNDQEREFRKTYRTQMKIVEETLGELKHEINKALQKEEQDKKFQKLVAERNFFRQQCIFLNEQNNSRFTRADRETGCFERKAAANTVRKRPFKSDLYKAGSSLLLYVS